MIHRGGIIASHAFDGVRRYSNYSQLQPSDQAVRPISVHWPLGRGIGTEPTFAQKIVSLRGHPFWLNISPQDDSYDADDLAKCRPSHLWIYVFNALGVAASDSRFDEWSVQAHVRSNRHAWTRGCFRYGPTSSSSSDEHIPLCPRIYSALATSPPSWRELNHSRPGDVLYRSRRFNRNPTRISLQSRAVYMRSSTSTDTASTPVGGW